MPKYHSKVSWSRGAATFTDGQYSRGHLWEFDGGAQVPASASPHIVPVPLSVEQNVDPEEAFVASLSSCHMLWFLSIAADRGFLVDSYVDEARGVLGKDANGRLSMNRVTLYPDVEFSGEVQPTSSQIQEMHHEAHEKCFIANSVKTEVITKLP